jgi:hypothetical protein
VIAILADRKSGIVRAWCSKDDREIEASFSVLAKNYALDLQSTFEIGQVVLSW